MINRAIIIGNYGYGKSGINGQTIKTIEITRLLKKYSAMNIVSFDSQKLHHKPWLLLDLIFQLLLADIIVYLPGKSNLRILFPIIWLCTRFTKPLMFYFVVGGWLDSYLQDNPSLINKLKKFTFIGVETYRLKHALSLKYNFTNVVIFPNFRIGKCNLNMKVNDETLQIVFMARINSEKGCDLIFDVAKILQDMRLKTIRIYFYGPIDDVYEKQFKHNLQIYKDICSYGGIIESSEVCQTLNNYDVLILPTRYEGEGSPGSIIDAYRAGIPVIVSNWKDLPEFVDEGRTGYVISDSCANAYLDKILEIHQDRVLLKSLKKAAYIKSECFSDETAWNILHKYIN